MKGAQIIADNMTTAHLLEVELVKFGWSSESISFNEMMKCHSDSAGDYHCLNGVVDRGLHGCFGGMVDVRHDAKSLQKDVPLSRV